MISCFKNAKKPLAVALATFSVVGLVSTNVFADTAQIDSLVITKVYANYQGNQYWQSNNVAYSCSGSLVPGVTRMISSFVSYSQGQSVVSGTEYNGSSDGGTSGSVFAVNKSGSTMAMDITYQAKVFINNPAPPQYGGGLTASATLSGSPQ